MSTFTISLRAGLVAGALLLVAYMLAFVPMTAQAGPQDSCGGNWEEQYYLIQNPFGPTDFASDQYGNQVSLQSLWSSTYGGGSNTAVVSSGYEYAAASVDEMNCGGDFELSTLPTAVIVALPSTIVSGQSSTLTWGSSNATSCTGTNFSTGGATSGSLLVSPTSDTTYSVSCTDGTNTANAATTVFVTQEEVLAPTVTLSANPASVAAGSSSTLTWTSTNADSCFINQGVGAAAPAAGGSTPVSPGANTTYTITCTGAGGEATAQATVTVTAGTGPDLTASAVSPSTAVLSTAKTFSATVSNIGNASTGSTFNNVFQIDSNSDHNSGVTTVSATPGQILGASGTQTISVSRTFGSVGTWYMRACSDANTSMNGTITETNEANNCGAWTAITVSETETGGPAVSCSVSDTSVEVGETVTYTAVPSGGAGAPYTWTDTPDEGDNIGDGTVVHRTYDEPGFYSMRVTANGASTGDTCEQVVVGGGDMCPGTPTATISASPDRVRTGNSSTITWSAQNVEGSCTISGPGISQTAIAASCTVPSTSQSVTINAQSVYRITCTGAADTAVVNLLPLIEEF